MSDGEDISMAWGGGGKGSTIVAICMCSRTGLTFMRDSTDKVYLLQGIKGKSVMDGDATTETVIQFMDEFPDCIRCVPIRSRRRKAVRAAMKMIQMGVGTKKERT